MAKFTIYSPDNVALYTGTPTFTGQYMKPGMLEFREVSLPMLIDLRQGCYVGYESGNSIVPVYPRTGFSYKLYSIPQVKKQARPYSYGAAFVYQGVQFYDPSKELEYCPFRDLVQGDNRIHFSTQPSISTFEGCDGLARRFEACLCEQYDSEYGRQSWRVRIATEDEDGVSEDFENFMKEPREFTVSGVNILECLDKVYEIWPDVGWIYTIEYIDEYPTNTIIIGGAGLNANTGTYAYGKGRGLTSITRTVANAEEMANRIYAYGGSRNLLPRWYNSLNIKDAESVDIQNLMIPVTHWGITDEKYDASKAYIDNTESIERIGLRPKTIYFDGSGEYADIYPTIRNKTIEDVRNAFTRAGLSSSSPYYPSTTIYTNDKVRIDRVLSVGTTFDSGLSASDGKQAVDSHYEDIGEYDTITFPAGTRAMPVYTYEDTFTPSASGEYSLSLGLNIGGTIALNGIKSVNILATLSEPGENGRDLIFEVRTITVAPGESSVTLGNLTFNTNKIQVSSSTTYNVGFLFTAEAEAASSSARTCTVDFSGGYSLAIANYRSKTFNITLRQVGFDIGAQANLGDGKTIAMRSGKCMGRSFTINSVQYDSTNDAWVLECWRSEDESLSQWFPNSDYPIRGLENAGQQNEYLGDEFVLLDIAMPEIYIEMAEADLYDAAQDFLADASVERWQYVPEIDAKFMVENNLTIRSGEYMAILDMDFIEPADGTASYFVTSDDKYFLTVNGERIRLDDGSGSVMSALVDSVVINEGEAAIPTYKVTLRDRKKKTWTESKGAETTSSKPVGSAKDVQVQSSATGVGSEYFELDDNGNVTLKSPYENLWVPGWLAAGGVGTGGGGGGSSTLAGLSDVTLTTPISNGQALVWDTDHWKNGTVSGGGTDLTAVWQSLTNSGSPVTPTTTTKIAVDHIPDLPASKITSGTLDAARIPSLNYLPLSGGSITGNISISGTLTVGGNLVDWFVPVTVDGSTTLKLNTKYAGLWAEGWMAAGGTGSGGSGSSTLDGLSDVSLSSPSNNQVLYYYNGYWRNTTLKSVNQQSLIGSGNITISGGVQSVELESGTQDGTLKLTVGSDVTDNIAVTGLGELAFLNVSELSDDYVTLDTTQNNISGAKTFTNAVTIGSTGSLSVHQSSHIDIGPVRIKFENNALHITKASSGDTNNYGIYADGFVSAGGIQQSS